MAAFNGQPALEFDGVDDSLAQSVFTAITNRTIVIVGRNTYTGTPALSYFCDGLDNSNRSVVGRWPDTTDWLIQAGTNLAGGTPDSNLHLFVADFAATDALYIDGTSIFSGNAGTHGTTGLRIGVDRTSTGNPLLGFIAFIGLYEGTLDATAKANLRTWAQTKYGTP